MPLMWDDDPETGPRRYMHYEVVPLDALWALSADGFHQKQHPNDAARERRVEIDVSAEIQQGQRPLPRICVQGHSYRGRMCRACLPSCACGRKVSTAGETACWVCREPRTGFVETRP